MNEPSSRRSRRRPRQKLSPPPSASRSATEREESGPAATRRSPSPRSTGRTRRADRRSASRTATSDSTKQPGEKKKTGKKEKTKSPARAEKGSSSAQKDASPRKTKSRSSRRSRGGSQKKASAEPTGRPRRRRSRRSGGSRREETARRSRPSTPEEWCARLKDDLGAGRWTEAVEAAQSLGRAQPEDEAGPAVETLCRLLADPKAAADLPDCQGTPGSLVAQAKALASGTTAPRARVKHSGKLLTLARALEQGKGDQRPARELAKLLEAGELSAPFALAARRLLLERALAREDWQSAEALVAELGDGPARQTAERALSSARARAAAAGQDLRAAAESLRPGDTATTEQRRAFARVQRARGDRCAASGDLERALECWRETLAAGEDDPDLLQNVAILTESTEGEAAAIPCWKKLVEKLSQASPRKAGETEAPRLFEAEKQLARLLMRQRSTEAVIVLERLAERASQPERILDNLAEQLLAHGRPGRAAKLLQRLLKDHGETPARHVRLAQALLKEPPVDPHSPRANEVQTKRENVILDHVRRALELTPEDEKLRLRFRQVALTIAERREDDGRFEEGLELVGEVLHANPEGMIDPAMLLAARLEFRVGHETLAQGMLETYAASSEGPETWLQVADQYLELGELREASRCFEEAQKRKGSPDVLGRILVAYLEHGFDQVARRWCQRAASIRPSELTKLVGQVQPLAPEIAWDLGQRAIRRGGRDPVLHLHLGRAALDRRDAGGALESCAAGRSLLKDDPRPDRKELLQGFDQIEARLEAARSGRSSRGGRSRGGGRRR